MNAKRRTWEILEAAQPGDRPSRVFDVSLVSLVVLNVIAVIIGSVQSVQDRYGVHLYVFEVVSVLVFTIEYLARLWSSTSDPRFRGRFLGRVKCALQAMSIIDLIAILPFYLPFVGFDLRTLRVLRLLRIIRVAKVGRYYSKLTLIKQVFHSKKEELILTSALIGLLLVVSSSLLYYAEHEAQPEAFTSIPAAMWWAVVTLTTVGYGDIYPVTLLGKVLASVVALLGIGMFALPAGILGSGFVETFQHNKTTKTVCPHCGKEVR